MIHYTTRNKSALKMYYAYKEMGIENCHFHLELKDEALIDVDPWDDNLTQEIKERIIVEISSNPWYFFREVCRIPEAGSTPFEFHRGNIAIIWAILNDISFMTVMPRQTGKTYTVACVYYWIFYWGTQNTTFMLFGNSESLVKNNLERIKKIRDETPEYMHLHKGKDNQHELSYEILDNQIKIKAPGNSKEDAMKVGRGFSTPIQWYDEFAFIPHIQHQYESALYAYGTVSQIAKRNKLPYHKAISTTAAPQDNASGKWSYNFLTNCADFDESLYDMDIDEVKDHIHVTSNNGVLRIEFMYYDLSKDDEYFERMVKETSGNWDTINREVLNMWMDASRDHPLGQDLVIALNNKIKPPIKTIIVDGVYMLKIYRDLSKLDWDRVYVGGIDCGGNVMKDYSTLVIMDPTNFEVIATLRSNSYSTNRFSRCIAQVMSWIFPKLTVLIERNSMGIAIADNILEFNGSLKSRMYHDESNKPGIANNQTIRSQLYNDILKVAALEDANRIHDRNIIQEIGGLIVTRSGRIDHQSDGHDDTLMAYLLARWYMTYAKGREKYIPMAIIRSRTEATDYTDTELERLMSKTNVKDFFNGARPISLTGTGGIFNPVGVSRDKRVRTSGSVGVTDQDIFDSLTKARAMKSVTSATLETVDGGIDEEETYDMDPDQVKEFIDKKKTSFNTNQDQKAPVSRDEQMAFLRKEMARTMR